MTALIGCSDSRTSTSGNPSDSFTFEAGHQSPITQDNEPSLLINLATMLDIVEHSVLEVSATAVATNVFGSPVQGEGVGSAWVIDSNGTLITAEHVIHGATNITVTTIEGKTYPAEVVNADPLADVAVLKVETSDLPALKVGDSSQLRVGNWVILVGNPLGQGISAKQGIVSRLGVRIEYSGAQTYRNMIEVSCAINPGNSGGPLVNLVGEVIGIAIIKVFDVGIEGMGYASSMTDNLPVIQTLLAQ